MTILHRRLVQLHVHACGSRVVDIHLVCDILGHFRRETLSVNGECHSLELEGKLGCYRVVASESFKVNILPISEV